MDGAVAWIVMASTMTVLVSCHQACFIGSEYNPQSGIPPRWFLPTKDPCECTAIRLGGMIIQASSYLKGAPYYLDELLLSEDSNEIHTYFDCNRATTVQTGDGCLNQEPLGLEDGTITDDRITASSHQGDWIASEGRLNDHGAWKPHWEDTYRWIEVNLIEIKLVSGVITQGHDYTYVTQYKVAYKKQPSTDLEHVTDRQGVIKVFNGNTDDITPVTNLFDESVVATVVRIEPTAWEVFVGLRLELLGCHLK